MSAQPSVAPVPDHVNIEIDGIKMTTPKGSMIIQAADKHGIQIPRFCYHEKLAIAANCRMCLVDVEKAPKPMPACATPVMEGMKVSTRSKRALDSQRNVMEFLLVNHPLDCPICDQGGECELQDLAIGYGRSVSRFSERKRVVPDEDLGPLVATDMTRCIHCTRCVRFTDEIAGTRELGGMYRGEHLEIGTYLGEPLRTELSGNVIDLCPVGALTNKVFRFRARPWELIARDAIGFHDAIGSNLHLHLRRGEVMRTVPRDNESINESWLSDRDRYSHQGLTHADRLTAPRVKRDGNWMEVSWEEALKLAAQGMKAQISAHGPDQFGALVSPGVTAEELFLAQALVRGLGSSNIDHRFDQLDFSDDTARLLSPRFAAPLAEYPLARSILLVGSHPRLDAPILGHLVRRAWRQGAQVHAINPLDFEHHFELTGSFVGAPAAQLRELAGLAAAVAHARGVDLPEEISALGGFDLQLHDSSGTGPTASAQGAGPHNQQQQGGQNRAAADVAKSLIECSPSRVLFGEHAVAHPASSILRRIAQFVATHTDSSFDEMPAGANGVAAWRLGCVPHRGAAGASVTAGLNARELVKGRRSYLLYGADVPQDFAFGSQLVESLKSADFVLAFAAFRSDALEASAHVILPIGLPPEVDGSHVNVEGKIQTTAAAAKPPGAARPGWRVLRALGELLQVPGFDFIDFASLHARVETLMTWGSVEAGNAQPAPATAAQTDGHVVQRYNPIYAVDALVRHSAALQGTPLGESGQLKLHPEDALALGIGQQGTLKIADVSYLCEAASEVPRGVCMVIGRSASTAALPVTGERLQLEQVAHG